VTTTKPLRELLLDAHAVLLDFDGPLCALFGGRSTADIATEIKAAVRAEGGTLTPEVEGCTDSHGILRCLSDMYGEEAQTSHPCAPLELADSIVTCHEYAAVNSAVPTALVEEMTSALLNRGKRLVIVSNNAEGPVWEYLKRRGLQSRFTAVCGRDTGKPHHMKPHPHSVLRALESLNNLAPAKALMVGDQLTDLHAAQAAQVPFLGFTQDPALRQRMVDEGADHVVASHAPVIEAVRALR